MLTRDQKILLRHLRKEAAAWAGEHAGEGFVYDGPAGFVLDHGEWFEPRPTPPMYAPGAPAMCYGNAIVVSAFHDLPYFEGYAVDPGKSRSVFQHAWNRDETGLVDVTWAATVAVAMDASLLVRGLPGAAYLGVRFSIERADDATWNGDASVLDDFRRGWPLLRQRWEGEPEQPVEYPGTTERLRIIRERDLAAYEAMMIADGRRP